MLFAEMELYSLQSNATMEILQMEMGAVLYVRLNQDGIAQVLLLCAPLFVGMVFVQRLKTVMIIMLMEMAVLLIVLLRQDIFVLEILERCLYVNLNVEMV